MNSKLFSFEKITLLLISFALLRTFVAVSTGLGVDEAHYLLYAHFLDLSYFDHPPLVGWIQYPFTLIFGETNLATRLPAIIIGFIGSLWIYKLLLQLEFDEERAFYAILALNSSLLFNALFLMLMPDTLLYIFAILLLHILITLEKEPTLKNWFLLGLVLGLAGLSKYTAFLFVLAIAAYVIYKKAWHLLFTPKLLIAVGTGFILILPIIIWNMQNDWISFTYQSNHVVGSPTIKLSFVIQSLIAQMIAYSPFIFPIAFYGLYKGFKSKNNLWIFAAFLGLVVFLFFTYTSLYKKTLPHWPTLFYYLFIPLGTFYLYGLSTFWRRYVKFSIFFSLLLSLVLYFEMVFRVIPFPEYQSYQDDIYVYDKVMKSVDILLKDEPNAAFAVTHWTQGSRAFYYNLEYKNRGFVIDSTTNQFDFWQEKSAKGYDILFINTHFFFKNIAQTFKCDSIEKAQQEDIILHGKKINSIDYIWCRNYQGFK